MLPEPATFYHIHRKYWTVPRWRQVPSQRGYVMAPPACPRAPAVPFAVPFAVLLQPYFLSHKASRARRGNLLPSGVAFAMTTMTTTATTQTEAITAENVLRLFPEVNTSLATTARADDNDLEGYDEEQIRLMDEVCIVLDENDNPIGSASKKVCESPSPCLRIYDAGR